MSLSHSTTSLTPPVSFWAIISAVDRFLITHGSGQAASTVACSEPCSLCTTLRSCKVFVNPPGILKASPCSQGEPHWSRSCSTPYHPHVDFHPHISSIAIIHLSGLTLDRHLTIHWTIHTTAATPIKAIGLAHHSVIGVFPHNKESYIALPELVQGLPIQLDYTNCCRDSYQEVPMHLESSLGCPGFPRQRKERLSELQSGGV